MPKSCPKQISLSVDIILCSCILKLRDVQQNGHVRSIVTNVLVEDHANGLFIVSCHHHCYSSLRPSVDVDHYFFHHRLKHFSRGIVRGAYRVFITKCLSPQLLLICKEKFKKLLIRGEAVLTDNHSNNYKCDFCDSIKFTYRLLIRIRLTVAKTLPGPYRLPLLTWHQSRSLHAWRGPDRS